MSVLIAHLRRLPFLFENVLLSNVVIINLAVRVQLNARLWFQVDQIAKHFSPDVVVAVEDHIARLARVGRRLVPTGGAVWHVPHADD